MPDQETGVPPGDDHIGVSNNTGHPVTCNLEFTGLSFPIHTSPQYGAMMISVNTAFSFAWRSILWLPHKSQYITNAHVLLLCPLVLSTLMVPATSRISLGLSVPIPTAPFHNEFLILILSILFVLTTKS